MHVGGGWVGFSISKFARHMRVLVELGKILTGFFFFIQTSNDSTEWSIFHIDTYMT